MNLMLKMACRVVAHRMEEGEGWERIMEDYPRLTPEEQLEIRQTLQLAPPTYASE